ncbi:hypothetical protein [Leptothermofonsia sp. ETS-13]|uniref:hypothetical protein n=1 Tax=Leptothermofonsia sp. ETS-13 TaxID=3035696 RepID=UPI003BA34855
MPLIWLFYSQILQLDPIQAQIILLKQPVNGILNALIASLLITHLPVHRWLRRSRAVNTLSFQQTLFNLLVAFVFLPTLLLIVLASRGVVETIKTTAQSELNQVSASALAEVRSWYSQYLQGFNELAHLGATEGVTSPEHLQQRLVLSKRLLPDLVALTVISTDKTIILASTEPPENLAIAHPINQS